MVYGIGSPNSELTEHDVEGILIEAINPETMRGKKVMVLTPDRTRTFPHAMFAKMLLKLYSKQTDRFDFMVALGTHKILSSGEIETLFGLSELKEFLNERVSFTNHRWDLNSTFKKVGYITKDEISNYTGGIFSEEVEVSINKKVFDYDLVIILGPVFPHEVVGFSGGYKYFFPGISGGEFLHFFHWFGAVLTNLKIIGNIDTPVRDLINRASEFLNINVIGVSVVIDMEKNIKGLFVGNVKESWLKAAELSSRIHIKRVSHPFRLVIGVTSEKYDELWTGGKSMYKLEPVVEDGGKLIIYAPHIKTISHTWGNYIRKIGYHTKDYFIAQMDRFKDIPRAVIAHSTHVKGAGKYQNGIEEPRIEVILATSIPEDLCREINLGYMNPDKVNLADYQNREQEGVLVVNNAGEILYRLKD